MELTTREWVDMLAGDYPMSKECVIFTTKYRKNMPIRKDIMRVFCAGFKGVQCKAGSEITLVSGGDSGTKLVLPDWVSEQLALKPGDTVCITKHETALTLKKLMLTQWKTEIPGFVLVDKFSDHVVERIYTNRPAVDEIKTADLQAWLALMGTFTYDPLEPFKSMPGPLGLLARITLLGESSAEDRTLAARYRQEIADNQQEDGSWDGDVMKTAAVLIQLLELDMPVDDPLVKKAVAWLLALPEPEGLPGLFMFSEKLAERFNTWKSKPGAKGRPHRRESKGELQAFLDNVDFVINYANDPCELRLTWTSALILEALFRVGLHENPRVIVALNTLFKLSGQGGWCGCSYLDANWQVDRSDAPVDFNDFVVPQENTQHHVDWFPTSKDIENLACGGQYSALDMGERRALLVKSWHSTGLCSMVMYRALSHHPAFAGSALQAYGALRTGYCQSSYGTWGRTVFTSSMLGFLGRLSLPLAAFMVLRSVPMLIRTQEPDGMWQEQPLDTDGKLYPVPSKAESSYMILRALKALGFLEPLLPK